MIGRAGRDRPRLRHRGRRLPVVESVEDYGLLAHQSLDDMLAGGGEREVFGAEQQAPPGRLRAVEAGQAGRAGVAVAVGRRPPGLAHRVRGDVARPARRGLRPALRRAGPASSRTTRTSGPRPSPSASASPTTGCTTPSSSTPRARRCRSRLGNVDNLLDLIETVDPRAYRMVAAAGALPLAGAGRRAIGSRRRSAPSAASMPSPAARATLPDAEPDAAVLCRVRGPHGRRPRHAGRHGRRLRHRLRAPTPRSTPATPPAPRRSSPRCGRCARPWASSPERTTRCPRTSPGRSPPSTPPGPSRDFAVADTLRRTLQAEGWVVETTKDGTRVHRA